MLVSDQRFQEIFTYGWQIAYIVKRQLELIDWKEMDICTAPGFLSCVWQGIPFERVPGQAAIRSDGVTCSTDICFRKVKFLCGRFGTSSPCNNNFWFFLHVSRLILPFAIGSSGSFPPHIPLGVP